MSQYEQATTTAIKTDSEYTVVVNSDIMIGDDSEKEMYSLYSFSIPIGRYQLFYKVEGSQLGHLIFESMDIGNFIIKCNLMGIFPDSEKLVCPEGELRTVIDVKI